MTKQLIKPMQVIQQGGENFLPASSWVDNILSSTTHAEYDLTAARAAMALPAGAGLFVILAFDGPFWANFYGTAVIPTGAVADGTGSEFSPTTRYLDSTVTSISVVSAANQKGSLIFYRP